MKCRICGKNVEADMDICEECLSNTMEETKPKQETLSIKRKHSLKFELIRYFGIYLIFILSGIMTEKTSGMICCLILLIIVVGFLLFWNKRISKATVCKFGKNKIEYKCNFWFINNKREITYKNLDCIIPDQTLLQRIFDLGDICIYAKKGNLLTTGIQVKNIGKFKEKMQKINSLIEEKQEV